jgi:hypothetical protein
MTGLTLQTSWEPSLLRAEQSSFSPAVPPTCHKQRSPTVSSGHSRSLKGGPWARRTSLTCGGGAARNCMACKGSTLGSALSCPAGRSVRGCPARRGISVGPPLRIIRSDGDCWVERTGRVGGSVGPARLLARWSRRYGRSGLTTLVDQARTSAGSSRGRRVSAALGWPSR